jgi:hypothetical protein
MSIRLRLGDEVFDIPTVGNSNWGEQITLYLRKNSEIIATIQGPQDILLTEASLADGASSQPINGLSFDTSIVQQIQVEGLITRTFTSGTPKVDSFKCSGVFDGSDFYIDSEFTGTDADVSIDINAAGQFIYTSQSVVDTDQLTIKFRGQAIIDV